jgi:hypothetical protein
MNKTISINPDLFRFTNERKTRRTAPPKPKSDIKVRSQVNEKDKQKKMRKQHILRFIREQQERNCRNLMETTENKSKKRANISSNTSGGFNSDFDESLKYLSSLSENVKPVEKSVHHNQTFKQYPVQNLASISEFEPLVYTGSLDNHPVTSQISLQPPKFSNSSAPKWGCMKNGSLPTYRSWKNTTQKMHIEPNAPIICEQPIISSNIPPLNDSIVKRRAEMRANMNAFNSPIHTKPKNRYLKQKRTVRRTYKLGRSQIHPKVSVLISNRTIRNRLMTDAQELKQTPIDEVKRFLVKNGFVRVGSSAPNDVLRKMYETAKLMCGEIKNHNPENLLYNFLHDTTDT